LNVLRGHNPGEPEIMPVWYSRGVAIVKMDNR